MAHELASGQIVGGRYIARGPLGRGGMAAVYRAFDPRLRLDVALKVLPAHLAKDPTFVARFRREAQTLAKLTHPHILRLFDAVEDPDEDLYYLVLELLDGGTLDQRLTPRPWSVQDAVALLRPVASALVYAHSQRPPVVHRDLKPSNVMFDRVDRPVVTDFGLARMLADDQPVGPDISLMNLTMGQVMGTPSYMAPEQAQGERAQPSFDLYALGVIAYELLTGRVPFQADTPLATLLQVLSSPLPLPSSINPSLAPATERVLLKALARRPEHRFSNAQELVEALASSTAPAQAPPAVTRHPDTTVLATPARPAGQRRRLQPSAPLLAAGIGGAVLVLAIAAFALVRPGFDGTKSAVVAATVAPGAAGTPDVARQGGPPAPAALRLPTSTAVAILAVAPTPTDTPPVVSTATPGVAAEWQRTLDAIGPTWGSDWPTTIALLEAFLRRYPDDPAATDKRYSAVVNYGQALLDSGRTDAGIAQLERAASLDATRTEAQLALAALTPTSTPPPTPTPTPTPTETVMPIATVAPPPPPPQQRRAPSPPAVDPQPAPPLPPPVEPAVPPTKAPLFSPPPPTKAPFAG